MLQFPSPVYCPVNSLIIGSKLDLDSKDTASVNTVKITTTEGEKVNAAQQCRLAFFGPIKESFSDTSIHNIKIYNWKFKYGEIFKVTDSRLGLCYEAIGQNMFSDITSLTRCIGMKILTEKNKIGVITGPYGADGKFKIKFEIGTRISTNHKIILKYKRYIYDKTKAMHQPANVKELILGGNNNNDTNTNNDISMMEEIELPDDPNTIISQQRSRKSKSNKNSSVTAAAEVSVAEEMRSEMTTVATSDITTKRNNTTNTTTNFTNNNNINKTTNTPATSSEAVIVMSDPHTTHSSSSIMQGANDPSTVTSSQLSQHVFNSATVSNSARCNNNSDKVDVRLGTVDSIKTEQDANNNDNHHVIIIVKDAFRMEENIKEYSTPTDDQRNLKYDVYVKYLDGSVSSNTNTSTNSSTDVNHSVDCGNDSGGVLKGPFAKMGKCKVQFPLNATTSQIKIGDKVEIIIQKK